ncbi:MAG: CDP-alcohol phosphatidyltransferase family protein, partial [Bacteriovorax sp.]|nr:CDP-alcohol phosphatidyltransferase family protein [Rhizobacter sp.]
MIDRQTTALIRPALERLARQLVRLGIGADALTFAGLAVGWAAAGAIALQASWLGAALILVSRLFDGLDGAVARATTPTDRGGFLDISLDFLFYPAIPLAFAIADPAANALAAAVLLAAFVGTGTCFLAFATIAAKRALTS